MEAVLIPLTFFGFLGAVIVVPIWLKERTKQSAHQLISQALEKGQQLDPALMDKLTETTQRPQNQARKSLGSGLVLLALGAAFGAVSLFSDGFDPSGFAGPGLLVPAVILGALGAAFLILAIVDYMTMKKTGA